MAGCPLFYAPSASNAFPASPPRNGPRPQENSLLDLALKTNNKCTSRLVRLPGQVRHGCCGGRIHSPRTASNYVDDDIHSLLQVTLDLGRLPQACYLGDSEKRDLRKKEVSMEELEYAQNALGEFGGNNRTGIAGTLHRVSAIRNKNGRVVGLTCRLGRPVREIIELTRDLLEYGKSILFLGRPGVGKTTAIRGISHVLSDELLKRVVGGLKTVILSDEAARTRNCKKIILERRSAPVFPFLIEMREMHYWVAHRLSTILVDDILELYSMMLIVFTLLLYFYWPAQ
ncbi:UNVERIFIED_CONTAM: putative protein ycf45 [Sesamum indicum]